MLAFDFYFLWCLIIFCIIRGGGGMFIECFNNVYVICVFCPYNSIICCIYYYAYGPHGRTESFC